MFIGNLTPRAQVKYYRTGTTTEIPPEPVWDALGWKWPATLDLGVDAVYTFEEPVFVGGVHLELAAKCATTGVEIWCDGACAGRHDGETGRHVGDCGGFDDVEIDKHPGDVLDVLVGKQATEVVVRVKTNFSPMVFLNLEICGAADLEKRVYPDVAKAAYQEGFVKLADLGGFACDLQDGDFAFCAEHLQQRIADYYPGLSFAGKVKVSFVKKAEMNRDAYALQVTESGITITAQGRRGLLYGIETLWQLGQDGCIPCCEIEDAPYKEMRGFHMGLPTKEQVGFFKRLVKYVLVPMRYNQLYIFFSGCMRFDRHPEITAGWEQATRDGLKGLQPHFAHTECHAWGQVWEKAEVSELCDFVRSYGIEVIPEVQSLGHVQYITYSHPELAEEAEAEETADDQKDVVLEDERPSVVYKHCYCPSNEKCYELIFDIIDEIVEAVRPERFVHIGHDEIYDMGKCPRCKDTPHDELLAYHINRLYDYIAAKGLGTMMWADMLQPAEGKKYQTMGARNKIPKDIVMLDFVWYFHRGQDIENDLLSHDFRVVSGNLNSSHFPRYEQRMKNMLGGEVSTWCAIDENTLGIMGKMYDLMYTAEMLWNPNYVKTNRPLYAKLIGDMQPQIRDEIRGQIVPKAAKVQYAPVALPAGKGKIPLAVRGALENWKKDGFDVSNPSVLDETPVEVKLSGKHTRLVFLQATLRKWRRTAWKELDVVGNYTVAYADGTTENIDITYAGNVRVWNEAYAEPMISGYYRHLGYVGTYFADPLISEKTEDGRDVCIMGLTWTNPHPEKEIVSVSCRGDGQREVALFGISTMDVQ